MHWTDKNAEICGYTGREGKLSKQGHDLKLRFTSFDIWYEEEGGRVKAEVRAGKVGVAGVMEEGTCVSGRLSVGDEKRICKAIHEEVLKIGEHPVTKFEGEGIGLVDGERLKGSLKLCGVEKELEFSMKEGEGEWVVKGTIRQGDFGIELYKALFGMIRVKDEVEIEIRLSR